MTQCNITIQNKYIFCYYQEQLCLDNQIIFMLVFLYCKLYSLYYIEAFVNISWANRVLFTVFSYVGKSRIIKTPINYHGHKTESVRRVTNNRGQRSVNLINSRQIRVIGRLDKAG